MSTDGGWGRFQGAGIQHAPRCTGERRRLSPFSYANIPDSYANRGATPFVCELLGFLDESWGLPNFSHANFHDSCATRHTPAVGPL